MNNLGKCETIRAVLNFNCNKWESIRLIRSYKYCNQHCFCTVLILIGFVYKTMSITFLRYNDYQHLDV